MGQLCRILKHGGASDRAIRLAREHQCDQCKASTQPTPANPAKADRVTTFNARVGLDVKYLTGWKVNQKVPALNIVDYASSYQMVIPLFQKENPELIRKTFLERWVCWAGMPEEIVVDPSKPNVGQALTEPLELSGATVHITAADARWQLGKVEVHGGWFQKVLSKVIVDRVPANQEQWQECVTAAHCKNELIQMYGFTPSQYVFGRNPRIAEHLMDEPLKVIPATAPLYEQSIARQVATPHAARLAVMELQDSRSLRLALAARPRVVPDFTPGTYVAYWRSQKWNHGTLDQQGAWHGPAIVLGKVGRNLVVIHKRSILRCAPEQLRLSTSDETKLARTPEVELLGIKNLIDQDALSTRQYLDLVPQAYPPRASLVTENLPSSESIPAESVPVGVGPQSPMELARSRETAQEVPLPDEIAETGDAPMPSVDASRSLQAEGQAEPAKMSESAPSSYGPIRRVHGKSDPEALHRPRAMAPDDFAELLKEVIPSLVERAVRDDQVIPNEPSSGSSDKTPAERGFKRSSNDAELFDPLKKRYKEEDEILSVSWEQGWNLTRSPAEVLSVQELAQIQYQPDQLSGSECSKLLEQYNQGAPMEVLLANYIQKKASKEVPASGNCLELQRKIDEAKLIEWNVVTGKSAARLVLGPEADEVRQKHSHRIMGSRYVVTVKHEDDARQGSRPGGVCKAIWILTCHARREPATYRALPCLRLAVVCCFN